MPANKHASHYLNAAYNRMIDALAKAETPAFSLFPAPDQFECAKDHARDIANAVDDYLHALVIDANSNATIPISTKASISILGDALCDVGILDDLQTAAEALREDAIESRARRFGVVLKPFV